MSAVEWAALLFFGLVALAGFWIAWLEWAAGDAPPPPEPPPAARLPHVSEDTRRDAAPFGRATRDDDEADAIAAAIRDAHARGELAALYGHPH